MRIPTAVLALLSLTACQGGPTPGPPSFEADASWLGKYVFRGTPLNTNGVVQAQFSNTLPIGAGESLAVGMWANWDVQNTTGAAFPDGNGGQLSEIDLSATYAKEYERFSLAYGAISYNLPNNVGVSTHELFVRVALPLLGFLPSTTLYADVDEVQGFYLENTVGRGHEIDERTTFDWGATLGFTDADHAVASYGRRKNGLADARLDVSVTRIMNDYTTASVSAHLASVLGGELTDALRDRNLPVRNAWVGFTVAWSF